MKRMIKALVLMTLALAALTMAGCESDSPLAPAPITSEPVLDTAPPAVPTGLAAAPNQRTVKVTWDANVLDEDFEGFMVYRVVWGNWSPMLDLPQMDNLWIDDHPVDVACTYAVTALDSRGNESAWAAVNFLGLPEIPFERLQ